MVFLLPSNLQKAAVHGFMVRRVSFAFYRVLCNFSKILCVCIHIVFETEMFDARDGSCVRVFRDPSVEKIWSGLLAKSSQHIEKGPLV